MSPKERFTTISQEKPNCLRRLLRMVSGDYYKVQADLKANITLEEQIKRIIRHNLDLFLESSKLAHIVFNELSNGIDQEVLEELKKLRIDYIHFLADVLEEGKQEGVLRDVNCHLAAAGIIGMLDSAVIIF